VYVCVCVCVCLCVCVYVCVHVCVYVCVCVCQGSGERDFPRVHWCLGYHTQQADNTHHYVPATLAF
jgi:hypothetical protein